MRIIHQLLFREPDGRQKGRFFAVLSVGCLLTWVLTGLVLDGSHLFLFMGIAFAASGVAESLPEDRRRPAGLLRLIGIGVLGIYLAVLARFRSSLGDTVFPILSEMFQNVHVVCHSQ